MEVQIRLTTSSEADFVARFGWPWTFHHVVCPLSVRPAMRRRQPEEQNEMLEPIAAYSILVLYQSGTKRENRSCKTREYSSWR